MTTKHSSEIISRLSRKISGFITVLQTKQGVVTARQIETFLYQDEDLVTMVNSNPDASSIREIKSYLSTEVEAFSGQIDKSVLNPIRASIQGLDQSNKILPTVEKVIKAILAAYSECLESFEEFDTALVDLISNLDKAGEQTVEILDKSSKQLEEDTAEDRFILDNMKEVNQEVSSNSNLGQIQSTIFNRINRITETLEKKINRKEEYSVEVQKELERVKSELHVYKNETVELKSKVDHYQHEMIMDKLTGLHRKDYLETISLQLIDRFVKHTEAFTVVIFDLDDFKKVNDTYGHVTGDEVLKKCGEIVRRRVRGTDYAFRYGGEEFLILLGNAKVNVGCSVAFSILEQVRETMFKHNQVWFKCTASFGVTEYARGEDILETIERADTNLYKAKKSGKDAVFSDRGKFTAINRSV